mmetsp:Transcript_21300/g.25645  ORF Transcript_21300/g.25645 Transcript_21300/m.25645 type:complete len:285 (+) Transcript_21300:170-1024(+)|eukprot:CAMPEP_0197851140 /NCGR_PEP_ID=MMETSP1438-20131217/17369_1 /TAXON_ID=1461541 /ORGANISM="Pterosperma sp., Strain CCMP1384" /LENGTH=284 /DNA_ID=CAMNT_0043464637 /DNA_START=160 /DNA_END=1014 /DNA_ORIENTATION=+
MSARLTAFAVLAVLLSTGPAVRAIDPLDPEVPHDARNDQRLDGQWAEYMLKMSWSTIVEDYDLLGDRVPKDDPNYDWYVQRTHKLMEEVGELYSNEIEKLGLSPPRGPTEFPSDPELTSATYFDLYSYAQFKVMSRYITCSRQRFRITERIGRRSLEMMRAYLDLDPSGDADDLKDMMYWLEKILQKLKDVGYVTDAGITWPPNPDKTWEKEGELEFDYWTENPVILPSTQRLFSEEGFAQHFSSRTIEQLFAAYLVEARESPDFDPNDHSKERVVERWRIQHI